MNSSYIDAFFTGVVLSFGLIIPLGIQNIFIFNQGVRQKNFLRAFPSVVAATLCDSLLIILAVLGVSVLVLGAAFLKKLIFMIGFFFLMYMGFVTWHAKSASLSAGNTPLSAKQQVFFAVSVSLLNPHALLDTIGVIGAASLSFDRCAKYVYTLACILVSFFWFLGLAVAGHFIHRLDGTGRWLVFVNRLSALIIWGVAFYLGWQCINSSYH